MRNPQSVAIRRGGVTLVESALLLGIFLLFLFAVFEYGRFLMLTQVATNAARTGARYASVNVDKPANFNTTAFGSYPSINQQVINSMGGANTMIHNFQITVFPCDVNAMYQNPPVIQPKASFTAWNDASFTERIGVRITGEYRPILPGFVFFYTGGANSVPMIITAVSGSEG